MPGLGRDRIEESGQLGQADTVHGAGGFDGLWMEALRQTLDLIRVEDRITAKHPTGLGCRFAETASCVSLP